MLLLVGLALAEPSGSPALSDAARFERWSHFKDHGLPATADDPLNQAAIADGACRLLGDEVSLDGYDLWRARGRVQGVIAALGAAPPTAKPSFFVASTAERLLIPCSTPAPMAPQNFSLAHRGAALQNWYHALCAPSTDPGWRGQFDPAAQPQQMAVTAGLACIAACDANRRHLPARAMAALFEGERGPSGARDAVCRALPWSGGTDFRKAASEPLLAEMAAPLLGKPCGCVPK